MDQQRIDAIDETVKTMEIIEAIAGKQSCTLDDRILSASEGLRKDFAVCFSSVPAMEDFDINPKRRFPDDFPIRVIAKRTVGDFDLGKVTKRPKTQLLKT